MTMSPLPPLECLRFFEIAARHESFVKAAAELSVSASAVAHRVKVLEAHLGGALFERRQRGVRLNRRGKAYLKDVQRILSELQVVTERRRAAVATRRLKLVSVESVAEKWLMPRLAEFRLSHPNIVIELETDHRGVDPAQRDFDIWIAYVGETAAPRPEGLYEETLYEEALFPVCSPALIEARGRPGDPGRAGRLAAAVRPGLGRRLAVLVRAPGQAGAGPVAGVGLPPLQHGGGRRRGGHGDGHRPLESGRAGTGTGRAGPAVRAAGRRPGALLPHHDRRLPGAIRVCGHSGSGCLRRFEPAAASGRRPRVLI